jgi:uncharacterized HAD superfamily protein
MNPFDVLRYMRLLVSCVTTIRTMEISLFFALVFPVPVQIAQAIVRLATIFTGKQGSYNREVIILRQHKNKTKNVTMGVKISRILKFIGQVLLE